MLLVHNAGNEDVQLTRRDSIANLHFPWNNLDVLQTTKTTLTTRSSKQTTNRRAAKMEATMQLSLDIPFDLSMSSDPYRSHTHRIISITSRSPTLGMRIEQCQERNLPMLKTCLPGLPAAKIPNWRKDLRNAYITQVNDKVVKNKADIIAEIEKCRNLHYKEIKVMFSTIEKQGIHPQHGVPQIYHDQLSTIAQHIFEIQHECKVDDNQSSEYGNSLSINQQQKWKKLINKVKQKHNTFTLSQLKKRADWEEWNASIFKQLDQYHDQKTFDDPEPLPKGANLLSLCWVYLIKLDGFNTKKARCVCNGSPRFRGTVTLAETYASALDQTGAKMFWASVAINNYVVLGADASNAFAEAPPPKAPLYVRIDENYRRWYKARFPHKQVPPDNYVLRVRKALQGHPESPRLWAELIDKIIRKLNLKPCTHEKCLYFTDDYNGSKKRVIFLRQVDNFAIACEDPALAKTVIADINSKMSIDVKELGLISRYNGVDIEQSREYIKLHNTTYINKLLDQHKWLNNDEDKIHNFPLPMNPDTKYQHKLENAEPLTMTDKLQLEKKLKFTYRQAVGEIIYAMITCRPDVSYAIIKLSQYSNKPAAIHYHALIHLYKYLKATKTKGIYYWHQTPRDDLPTGRIPILKQDMNYDELNVSTRQTNTNHHLIGYVDSDHASDASHRRSVSGFHVKLAGGTVLYKTKYQNIVAQSSTEAEFIAAAEAGRYILYLRTIMAEIGLPQHHATVMYEDNQGALLMAKAGQPTKRTKHIATRYFALQDWVERDLLAFHRISTTGNSADAMTKATARTLFYRHNNHIMGKVIPKYVTYLKTNVIAAKDNPTHHIKCLAMNIFHQPIERQSSLQGCV